MHQFATLAVLRRLSTEEHSNKEIQYNDSLLLGLPASQSLLAAVKQALNQTSTYAC
jgi:hypothetical protein